jgi:hypothetical protein
MQFKSSISSFGLALVAFSAISSTGNGTSAMAQTTASEKSLALCETPSQTVRIYRMNGDTLMRAYDRQDGIVWMNRTPVSAASTADGIQFTNSFGEQTVTTAVNIGSDDCTIQLGNRAPEAGTLSESNGATLEQARLLYPEVVAEIEAACPSPSTLSYKSFQNEGQPPRITFACWSPPNVDGERTGQWLGNLPLTEDDPTFIRPFTCSWRDRECEAQLQAVQTNYPEVLESAELACSMKNGTLFFATAGEATDLRCGYMAVTVWDNNGDRNPDYEDAVSVDESVGQVTL